MILPRKTEAVYFVSQWLTALIHSPVVGLNLRGAPFRLQYLLRKAHKAWNHKPRISSQDTNTTTIPMLLLAWQGLK
jgi:hypothetical protein